MKQKGVFVNEKQIKGMLDNRMKPSKGEEMQINELIVEKRLTTVMTENKSSCRALSV